MDKHAAEHEHPSHQEQPASSPSSTYFVSKMVKICCSNHDPNEDNGSCVFLLVFVLSQTRSHYEGRMAERRTLADLGLVFISCFLNGNIESHLCSQSRFEGGGKQ